jgi:hypothetical protein
MPAMASFNYTNPENPYTLVDTPWGKVEAWRASTLATGEMSGYAEYMKQVRADASIINDSLSAREQELAERERNLSAREDAVSKREDNVLSMVADVRAAFDAVRKYADTAKEEAPVKPPGAEADEGDLEIKKAKSEDLEGDLHDPENAALVLPKEEQKRDEYETEFPIPGEPEDPDPDQPRAPSAFEDD